VFKAFDADQCLQIIAELNNRVDIVVVGEFVYEDSEQLVDLISHVKSIDGVDRVVWSEEVFLLAGKNIACMLS
jgi:hypothetical protein